MENALNKDLPVGIYRTNDEIRNLKIRFKVKKVANACFTSSDGQEFQDPNEIELVNLIKSSTAVTECSISWQQKIERIETRSEEEKKDALTIFIFTYTDSDVLSENLWSNRSITHPSSILTHLEKKLLQKKSKSRAHFHDIETGQKPLFSCNKEIVKEHKSLKHASPAVGQTFLIMASLVYDDGSPSEEIELCCLHYDDYGTLTVIPDFCKNMTFTFLNSRSETFEYEFENISNALKNCDIMREKSFRQKIELQKQKMIADTVGDIFPAPHPKILFAVNCEIVSAKNFSAKDIFIHYQILLPEEWESESSLEGTTETCRCKKKGQDDIAYFGYSFFLDVYVEKKVFTDCSIPILKALIEVVSVDCWGNFRNEGYGYNDIILKPGQIKTDLLTWKLEPKTLKSRLHDFFIGGLSCLEDLTYITNPKETKDAQLSKYGLQTISGGTVTFISSILKENSN